MTEEEQSEGEVRELAERIIEALRRFGGEAHRNMVIEHILLTSNHAVSPDNLREGIIACFERLTVEPIGPDTLFFRRFGEDSHRWTLGPGAARVPRRRD